MMQLQRVKKKKSVLFILKPRSAPATRPNRCADADSGSRSKLPRILVEFEYQDVATGATCRSAYPRRAN